MDIKTNSNHSNLAFDREIDNSKAWLETKITDACGHSSEILLDCLMQCFVAISHCPYTTAASLLGKATDNCIPAPGTKINCVSAHMETGSGRITVAPKQWLANQFHFFLHWAYCLIAILTIKKASKNDRPATLVFDIGEENLFRDGNDERFVNYCRMGPITPLREGKRLIVQSTSKNVFSCDPDFTYSRKPLIDLLHETNLGFFGRSRLLLNHWISFFAYMSATFRLPQLSLLGRDIAYSSIFFELDRHKLIESVVFTIGSYHRQPLWVRELQRSKVHMIWYSQNAEPIIFASDNVASYIPNFRWIRAGVHWVWTNSFAEYIRAFAHDAAIKVVGPIVWYMPEMNLPAKNALQITIIDILPFGDETSLLNGAFPNYYHPRNLLSFIKDIVHLKHELEKTFNLPVNFVLKPKRVVTGYAVQDRCYSDFLEELASSKLISFEQPSRNLYSMISGSHLVIVYPFSSPAYLAEYLKVPSIYYDPTKTIKRHDFGDSPSLINFANCPDDLLKVAIAALSSVLPDAVTVKDRVAHSSPA